MKNMKILKVTESVSEIVETDEYEYSIYRRHSANNWENLMGDSLEQHYDCNEIEDLYQEFCEKT